MLRKPAGAAFCQPHSLRTPHGCNWKFGAFLSPRSAQLFSAELGLEAFVCVCLCVCVCVQACPSMHCPQVNTGVHTWVCLRPGASWCHAAVPITVIECLLYTQHCVLCQVALAPASGRE